jgi:hypothetical protein
MENALKFLFLALGVMLLIGMIIGNQSIMLRSIGAMVFIIGCSTVFSDNK